MKATAALFNCSLLKNMIKVFVTKSGPRSESLVLFSLQKQQSKRSKFVFQTIEGRPDGRTSLGNCLAISLHLSEKGGDCTTTMAARRWCSCAQCELFGLRCHGHSLNSFVLLLKFLQCLRTACYLLDCPASEPTRRVIFGTTSIVDL